MLCPYTRGSPGWTSWRPATRLLSIMTPDDARVAARDLGRHLLADQELALVLLGAVGVAEVDHDAGRKAGRLEQCAGLRDVLRP